MRISSNNNKASRQFGVLYITRLEYDNLVVYVEARQLKARLEGISILFIH